MALHLRNITLTASAMKAGAAVIALLLAASILPPAVTADRIAESGAGRLLVPSTTQLHAATERSDASSSTKGQQEASAGSATKRDLPAALQGASVTFNVTDCRGSPVQGALVALDADCPYTQYLAPITTNSAGQALLKGVKQANFGVFCVGTPNNKCSWVGVSVDQQQNPTTYVTRDISAACEALPSFVRKYINNGGARLGNDAASSNRLRARNAASVARSIALKPDTCS
eukprot:gene700-1001_t